MIDRKYNYINSVDGNDHDQRGCFVRRIKILFHATGLLESIAPVHCFNILIVNDFIPRGKREILQVRNDLLQPDNVNSDDS